jgi:hypothetical protein
MSISSQHLLILISQGETDKIEFKTRLLNQHDISRVLSAFANSEGGYLIIGVGDDGKILGLNEAEALNTEKRLNNLCESLFSYPFEVGNVLVEGKSVVYARVYKAPEYLSPITTGKGETFLRQGSADIKVKLETRMFSAPEERPVPAKKIIGFVAMSFRDEEEPSLIDYYQAMLRAAKKTGLPIELIRMDLLEGDYEISQQLMNEIDKADFVLADYTLNSHNVYFEAGYAKGVKKRLIQTARKGVALQFDIRNWPTLFYRNATELEEKLTPKLVSIYDELT